MIRFFSRESQNLTSAALVIGAASLASRIFGIVRERLLVGHFGVGAELDAYYAAFQVPNILYNLLVLGTLSVAFIPVFVELWQKKEADAWQFTNVIFDYAAVVMGGLSIVVWLAAPVLVRFVAPGFPLDTAVLVVDLTRILVLSIFLFSLSSVFGSVLNAQKRFMAVSVAPLIYNVSIIVGILVTQNIRGVAWAVVIGALLHLLLQGVVAYALGWRWYMAFAWRAPGVGTFVRLFMPRILGMDIGQVSLFVGTAIGSGLAVGSVALFNLATNIEMVPVSTFGYAFSIAAFPSLTEALARKDREEFRNIFGIAARQIVFFLLPLGFLTIVLRAHIIRLIIGTRQLSWDDTRLAAAGLALFALTLCLQGLTPLFSRLFYAMKNTRIPVAISLLAIAVNVGSAWGLVWLLGHHLPTVALAVRALRLEGVPDVRMLGLPLAFSIAAAVQVAALAALFRVTFGSFGGRQVALAAAKMLCAAVLAAIAAYGGLQATAPFAESRTYLGLLLQTVVASGLGMAVYLLAAISLKTEEAKLFLASIRRRVLKITRPLGLGEGERL